MSNGDTVLQVFTTTEGKPLAEKICAKLGIELGKAHVGRFNDGEVDVQILENVRDHDVFIIAPTYAPADNLMEAIHLAEAARVSSAGRVTYVIPYMGYGRSDRKDAPRKPIGAQLAFKMLEIAQPDRFLMLDVHAEQTLACIEDGVFDHLYGSAVAVPFLLGELRGADFVVASPDKGGGPRTEKYAQLLGQRDFVFFSKSRSAPGEVKKDSIKIVGDVKGKVVVLVDDMIDTGGTMIADAEAALREGAADVWAFATHGLFSKNALQKFETSGISRVVVTDSVAHSPEELTASSKLTVLTVADLLADAVMRTHKGDSLTALIP
ncbi:ribose-phosphate diphosphokinase [Patescibacteria group bacterium]|nr:ribose-phosphate diphosphokinase [Patescibacteria group bacterium]